MRRKGPHQTIRRMKMKLSPVEYDELSSVELEEERRVHFSCWMLISQCKNLYNDFISTDEDSYQ